MPARRRSSCIGSILALFAVGLLALLYATPAARAEPVSESRTGYFAYHGRTDFFSDVLLLPHPLSTDLGPLVSKYIGETEQALDELFESVGRLDVVLLFDEADALFGDRTEVSDPHDPYADDFVILDLIEGYWRGQIYLARLGGVYQLDGSFIVAEPCALAAFAIGLVALGGLGLRRRKPMT